jgi:hypothetical protein
MELIRTEFICVCCEKRVTHSELIHKAIVGVRVLCADCVADAALGRAVRSMTAWMFLYQNSIGWFCGTEKSHGTREYGERHDTPEAALKAAGLMEGEGK